MPFYQLVLAVGNALNASSFRGGAQGFKLDALLKVSYFNQCSRDRFISDLTRFSSKKPRQLDRVLIVLLCYTI